MNRWLLVALLWGAALLNYLDRQVLFSLFPVLTRDLAATSLQLGLLSTVFLWTYGVLSPLGGYAADRFGRVRVILASLLLWSAATWITGHAPSIGAMLWARALMGASEAFYLPAALALIADRHDAGSRSLATGLHQSGLYTGMVLGGAWGGWMGDTAGWRPVFTILGFAGAAYFLVLLAVLRRDRPAAAVGFTGSLRRLLGDPSFLLVAAGFVSLALANWLVYTWLPLFLYERFHLTMAAAGFSATFYIQAASYAGVVAGGVLADRWSRFTPRARLYTQMAGLAAAAPFLALLSAATSMPLLIGALVVFGLGRGFFDCNTMPVLREISGAAHSATGYGILNLGGCLAGGFAVALAGYLKQYLGLGAAFPGAALILLLGAAALSRVRSPGAAPDGRQQLPDLP
ncbi:MAG: MFS transporter [Acidobacteriota bacterium]|nr:MFS transporter [Acidobacteriota bacterium]